MGGPRRALSLDGCRHAPFIDEGLAALRGLSRVAALNLQGCLTLTDAGLAALAPLTALASVNLQDCCALAGAPLGPPPCPLPFPLCPPCCRACVWCLLLPYGTARLVVICNFGACCSLSDWNRGQCEGCIHPICTHECKALLLPATPPPSPTPKTALLGCTCITQGTHHPHACHTTYL